ncbi:hypothetical protein T440DRAFT_468675 [Plenodomus tracheiphilus IPT5]|uniref:RING-type E3 ubiquitin transferase n=1 Tax=Plenodomus tracheiphilus IPT5 TaxID=1408161 RepID=A0A6A7B4Y9_9PLEO|nr:hypothetical protein T440DRAFT_468675 [Plenodomus tracheiphilus IPT5]
MATGAALPTAGLFDEAHDMATQASDTRSQASDSHDQDKDEADTCRICRGEATPEEPLFYPCKCSGSIKYVHQECLMGWLSHTQKKHCELCKTSFRFTKLYHPGMPNQIPTTVFIRRAALHVLKMFVTWCRGVLVFSVWLFLLPCCMRVVWRSLFWVGDGGWTQEMFPDVVEAIGSPNSSSEAMHSIANTATNVNTTRNTTDYFKSLSDSSANSTTNDGSIIWSFAKRLLFGVPYPFAQLAQIVQLGQYPIVEVNTTAANLTLESPHVRSPSLLSDVPFLKLFPSHTANQLFIDVLEGQIITIFVVIAFILIFLIREWVVQQQPVINMVALGNDAAAQGAADNANEHDHDDPVEVHVAVVEEAQDHQVPAAEEADVDEDVQEAPEPVIRRVRRSSSLQRRREEMIQRLMSDDVEEDLKRALELGNTDEVADLLAGMGLMNDNELQRSVKETLDLDSRQRDAQAGLEETRPIPSHKDRQATDTTTPAFPARTSSLIQQSVSPLEPTVGESSQPTQRPEMPSRDRSFVATEIQRRLEEDESWSFDRVPQASSNTAEDVVVPDSWEHAEVEDARLDHGPDTLSDEAPDSEHSSGSWQKVPEINVDTDSDQALEGARSLDKGKARASDGSNGGDTSQASTTVKIGSDETQAEEPQAQLAELGNQDRFPTSEQEVDADVTVDGPLQTEHQDAEIPPAAPAGPPHPPATTFDRALDWMFGDVAPDAPVAEEAGNDEHIVGNIADEAPFVPFLGNEPRDHGIPALQDAEVAAAAAQAGIDVNDQEAIEDAEDLEGILELIGMQGPLVGLFQNALFSAVLISATLACAVWLPYLWGKVVILFLGSPIALFIKLPVRVIAAMTDLIVDMTLIVVAGITYSISHLVAMVVKLCSWGSMSDRVDGPLRSIATPAYFLVKNALDRTAKLLVDSPLSPQASHFTLSVNSHAALRSIQNSTSFALSETSSFATSVFEDIAADSPFWLVYRVVSAGPGFLRTASTTLYAQGTALLTWLWTSKSYNITLDVDFSHSATVAYAATEYWTASDRMIAIVAGYGFFAFAGALYLKRGTPFSTSRTERIISDILQQAGGVLKVILIISIEMLAFPLYCGLLLDLAMLPLFQNATLLTRWQFTRNSPWTSGFVHWFIGTCYMFHFALFVSMCRKIMRKGVLYFIRDPDDPTFHPVRDVLERSVTTQLRKIAFSALVYGALVIVCLGGVVWSLSRATTNVLPIRWSTEAPSLEFPLDLLFYNFLTPVIIKFYKPSEGFHAVYSWWFKTCASFLRLSNFLFGDKAENQEGDDGKYVRAPASDQARIPKGQAVFVEVDKNNVRKDGQNEGGVHNTELVAVVFIPPWFRLRIFAFVVTIWLFMGLSGVSITILPLLFGRFLFSLFLPTTVEMNDIHAFSLGVYTLASITYTTYHAYRLLASLHRPAPDPISTLHTVAATTRRVGLRVLRFTYVWTSLIFAIPFLCAVLIELYLLMPLHAYLGPSEPHVIHLIQDWTLGFLYARLAARLVFSNRASRPARAFSAVIRNGYLNPDAVVATRCFLFPVVIMFVVALAVPASLSWVTNKTLYWGASEVTKNAVWRFSFPAVGLSAGLMWVGGCVGRLVRRWRGVVRDEVYLIGERLHNFGDRKGGVEGVEGRAEGEGAVA